MKHTLHNYLLLFAIIFFSACNPANEKMIERKEATPSKWSTVGFGGGGAMFYPQVSFFDPNFALVACDMTGSYVTLNGGESWRMFNLHKPVDFFVFDPLDSNTVYANGIGLFKSTDRGATWDLLYPSPGETTGFVAHGDHAEETIVTKDSTIRDVHALAIDPENSTILYAAISIDKSPALFLSTDGGQKWVKEKALQETAQDIFIDPSSEKNNRNIFITSKSGITVRYNRNWTFNKAPAEVHQLTHFAGGFDIKTKKMVIYAMAGKSYFDPEGTASGIYFTDNGGASWQNREKGLTSFHTGNSETPEWRTIATSAGHPEVLYVSYRGIQLGNDTTLLGVAKSRDFGKTWTLSWKDVLTKEKNSVAENFTGGWINDRFGPTWGENPFSIGVSPVNADVCYATDFGRTVKTIDGGKTWEQVYTRQKPGGGWLSRGLDVTTGYNIITDPFDKNHVFLCQTDIGLMESNDGGESWQSATKNNGVPRKWQNSTYWLEFDPEVKGKVWAAMTDVHDLPRPKMFRKNGVKAYRGGIMLSEDGGKSWIEISSDIGEGAATHVLMDPASSKESRTLYACVFGKGVYKSADGGKSWKQKNNGLAEGEPFAWRITRRKKDGVLFLVVCRRNENGSINAPGDGAIYRSDDGAETWKAIALPNGTNAPMSLLVDEENNKRLLLGAWGVSSAKKLFPDTGGGIFLSDDEGKTWRQVLQKDQHIHDISYDPRNKRYYSCGFNGSAYRSDDQGLTWSRIKGYNFKWGKRVEPDPSDPDKIFIITFGGGVWHGPAQGDENSIEDIQTKVLAY